MQRLDRSTLGLERVPHYRRSGLVRRRSESLPRIAVNLQEGLSHCGMHRSSNQDLAHDPFSARPFRAPVRKTLEKADMG